MQEALTTTMHLVPPLTFGGLLNVNHRFFWLFIHVSQLYFEDLDKIFICELCQ